MDTQPQAETSTPPAPSASAPRADVSKAQVARLFTMPAAVLGFASFAGINWVGSGTFTLLTPVAGLSGQTVAAMVAGIVGLAVVLTFQGVLTNVLAWFLGALGVAGILSVLDRPIVLAPFFIPGTIAAFMLLTYAALAARWDTKFFWDPNRERRKKTAPPAA